MPTKSAVAYTHSESAKEAALDIASQISSKMEGIADALIVFASSKYDYIELLNSLQEHCRPKQIIGCSSAGEFIGGMKGEGAISVLALQSTDMLFNVIKGVGLRENRAETAKELSSQLIGTSKPIYKHRSVLLLADALAGYTDEL
nr:FIST domain protein [Bdellovibrionales bacterium]